MTSHSNETQQLLRELLGIAREVRSRVLPQDRRLRLRDIFALSWHLTRALRNDFPDARIMVGDRKSADEFVQHHWVEILSSGSYIDPAGDALDPFQPVRVGNITDQEFACTYRNGQDANIDVTDPRNRPDILFKARSAFDSEG